MKHKEEEDKGKEGNIMALMTHIVYNKDLFFWLFFFLHFLIFHLRVKFAEGSRALVAHLGLFLYASYICLLCPTGIQLGFGLHRTIQRRQGSEAEKE